MEEITGDFVIDSALSTDDDMEEFVAALLVQLAIDERVFKWNDQRLDWHHHKERLLHQRKFHKQYRMTAEAFDVLVEIVRPAVEVNVLKSMASTPQSNASIFPELVVAIGIRYLCGGSHHDITSYIGVSDSSFYRCRDLFMDAVLSSEDPRLAIHWPTTPEEYEEIAKAFRAKSTHEIMRNCVGALDGLLIQIRRPTLKETDSADDYFSGHYQMPGLNCQGVCDSHYRFLFFAVAAPGKSGDVRAIGYTTLPALIDTIPDLYYLVGDAAYVASDKLLTPFKGSQKDTPENGHFNFFLSQLRIRIEAAFGLLTTKWSILRGGLTHCSLSTSSTVIMACAKLHNFVINIDSIKEEELARLTQIEHWRDPNSNEVVRNKDGDPLGFLPTAEEEDSSTPAGESTTRTAIVQYIRVNDYQRPIHNLLRNR